MVRNLPDSVTIQVTQKDIDAGSPLESRCCPIARAGRRAFNGHLCLVDNDLRVVLEGAVHWYGMPDIAHQFVACFDNDGDVEPFEFVATARRLEIDDRYVEECDNDEDAFGNPCQKCGKQMPESWDYAWCEACGSADCVHGNNAAECARCAVESDLAFDAQRERGA